MSCCLCEKRLLDVEFIVFCKGLEVPRRLLEGRVAIENRDFCVFLKVFDRDRGFLVATKFFKFCFATRILVSRHGSVKPQIRGSVDNPSTRGIFVDVR